MPLQQPEKLLLPEQVADMLSLSRVTVLRLAKRKQIPAVKLGKVYRFGRAAIENWVSAQQTATAS